MVYPFPSGPTIVGNQDANTVSNGFGGSYNPIAPSQVAAAQQQAIEAQQAEQQRLLDEQAAQLQEQYKQFATQAPQPAASVDAGLGSSGEFDFTTLAAQSGWADSSTFRREKMLNSWMDELTAKGATPEYISQLRAGITAKAAEIKQPVTHPNRTGGDVLGDVAAVGVGAINSLAGLAGDITSGIGFEKAGSALKQGSDSTVGQFERGLQSEETANLLKHANELMGEGDWKGLAVFIKSNPSLAAYVGARELVGSKGIGTAAKGVVKGVDLAVNAGKVVNAASKGATLGEASAAVKAANAAREMAPIVEKARTGLGLGVVGAALGRGSTINNAQASGIEVTDQVRETANANALAQGALGFLGGALGSAEARLGNTPLRSMFRSAEDFDAFAITAATAPKKAASFLKELGKTMGVEIPQEYAENFVGSLADSKVTKDNAGGGDLTQQDYDRAKAEGVFGAIAAIGPSLGAAGMQRIAEGKQVNAFNAEVTRQRAIDTANINQATAEEKAQAARDEAILAAQRTAADAMQELQATRAQREASNAASAQVAAQAEADARSADPLVAARAAELSSLVAEHAYAQNKALDAYEETQTVAEATAAAERRANFINMANKQIRDSESAGDTVTAGNVRAMLSTYMSSPPPSRNNAVWEQALTDGALQRLKEIAPDVNFSEIKGTSRSFMSELDNQVIQAEEAGNTDKAARLRTVLRMYDANTTLSNMESGLSPRDVVEGKIDSNGVPISQSRGLQRVAEIINAGQPVDVEAELVALSPNGFAGIGGTPARISFLNSLPVEVQQRLQQLDTQNQSGQLSLPGLYNTPQASNTDVAPTGAAPLQAGGSLIPTLLADSTGNVIDLPAVGEAAGYSVNAGNTRTHVAASDAALALSNTPELQAANAALAAKMPGALQEYNARIRSALETYKSPKQRALLSEYLKMALRDQRKAMTATPSQERIEQASEALSKWSYEYMAEYAGLQETPLPVRVDNATDMPRVKFREASWTPAVDAAGRKKAISQLGELTPAQEQARADRMSAVRTSLSALGLGKYSSSEQINNERNNLKVTIDEIKARLDSQEQLLAAAETALASTAKGDAINRGVLSTAVSARKKTVSATNTELKKAVAKLKTLDPVAHLELQREQDIRTREEAIKSKQAALDGAIAAKDLYETTNALAATSKKYATDVAKLDSAIKKATRALSAVAGDAFDFEAGKAQIEANYAKAVADAISITPETLTQFQTKVDSNNATAMPGTDFVAAYTKEDHQMNGTATRSSDNSHWVTQWTDTDGAAHVTTFQTVEEVFNHFHAIELLPTTKSISSGQSTNAVAAYNVLKRSGRYSEKLLGGMQTVFGSNVAKVANALDYLEFEFVSKAAALRQFDRHIESNGLVGGMEDKLSLATSKVVAFAEHPGVAGKLHLPDYESNINGLISSLSDNAKTLFGDYVHARGAGTRHEYLTAPERLIDPNTGKARRYTSGFSFVDPVTKAEISDPSGEKYLARVRQLATPEEIAMMENATKQVAYLNIITSRMEATNGVISEDTLQERIQQFESGKYYFPLKDKESNKLGKSVKGRVTKADDPLIRMMNDNRARLNIVARMAAVKELYDFAIEHPIPDLMTLNTRVEVADGKGNTKWVMEDPFSERSLRLIKPDGTKVLLTFADTGLGNRMFKNFRPDTVGAFVHYLGQAKVMFSSMVTTYSPTTQMAAIMRDALVVPLNMEQASRGVFDSATSARLSAKIVAQLPMQMPNAISGQYNQSTRSVAMKHVMADGGGITMATQRGFNQQQGLLVSKTGYVPTDGSTTNAFLQKAAAAKHKVDDIIHSLDVVTRQAYVEVALAELYGKKIETDEDMAILKSRFPEEYNKIVLGSKDITLNFEKIANNPYLRNLIPFFGTAMNATFRAMPRALSTKAGWGYLMAVMAASYLVALAEGEGGEEDADGKKKYFRGHSLPRQFCLGGACVPLPQELMVWHMLGTSMAGIQTNQMNIGEASMNIASSAVSAYSPIQGSESPNMGDQIAASLPFGFVLAPLITQRDYYGKDFANPHPYGVDGKPIDNPYDWERAYANSKPWAVDATKGAFDLTGGLIDVSPGAADATARILLGGAYNYADKVGKSDPITALLSRYTYKENTFGVQEQFKKYEEKYARLARDPAMGNDLLNPASKANSILDATAKEDKKFARQMSDIEDTIAQATANNDVYTLAQAQADKERVAKDRENAKAIALRQIYDLEKK